MAYHNVGLLGA